VKVVECEECGKKMSRLPSHMQEKWGGNVCKGCRKELVEEAEELEEWFKYESL